MPIDGEILSGPRRSPRGRRALVTRVVVAVVLLLSAAGCASSRSGPRTPAPTAGEQISAAPTPAVTTGVLVTTTGQRLDLASLRGKVVVVSDMMTLCQETCPLDTANVVAAARAVQAAGMGDRVEFLSVTIDPQRDTVARLVAYRKLYAPAPNDWAVATGSPAQLTALWKDLGVTIEKTADQPPAPRDWLTGAPLTYDLTHSDELFFFDARGTERFVLQGSPHVAAGAPIPPALSRFMDADGHQNLTHPDPAAWTLPQELQVVSWLAGHRVAAGS